METFFKKYFWTAQAGAIVVAALLLAGTVNGLVASAYAKYSVTAPSATDGPPIILDDEGDEVEPLDPTLIWPPEEPPPPVDLCAEVQCEEDQECNPDTGECEAVVDETADVPADGRCLESDIAINLVGTMVSDDPNWSIAILHNPSLGQTQFAQLGTNLLAEADVTRIERGRIFFMRNGREECLRPGDQQTRAARAPAQQNTAPARPARPTAVSRPNRPERVSNRDSNNNSSAAASQSIEERIRSGVTRADDGSYEVPRDLIQDVANDSSLMESQAPRVLPNYVNGQPAGFRLQGIRSGSIFSAIGIRNGDVIVSVNGTDIDSPQRAMELYQAMLQQEQVEMGILRRGQPHTLNYTIK